MEFIWSPWRYDYVAATGRRPASCVFCIEGDDPQQDAERLIVFRGVHNFVILNLFPYTSGHLMIAPFAHMSALTGATPDETSEMMDLAKRAIGALETLYRPDGFNVGMNLGHAAGAGVKDHLHLHVVPRWIGDASFTSVIGETRVLPEQLDTTFIRVRDAMIRSLG